MPTNEQRRQAAKRKLDRQLARRAARAKRRRTYAVAGSAAAVVLVVGLVVLITVLGGGDDGNADTAAAPSAPPVPSEDSADSADSQSPQVDIPAERAEPPVRPQPLPPSVDCQYPAGPQPPAKPVNPPPAGQTPTTGTVGVSLQTSAGTIPLTLERSLAPCAVKSFLSLTEQGYFNDTPCHRLTTGQGLQVLQCGDPSGTGTGGPGYSFADETWPELTYGRGYLAMANSGPNTNGSQFFLVYGDAQLPPAYTVFGTVSDEGLRVIDQVARAGAQGGTPDGPPATPVTITTATITN
ncbi:MAG TPA: peptidylprolyl isomerase [Pseudonocardiaceae bacterium]|nr:peptidylprolyl isomerase [Pseudonocardiaceae bacterium]